MTKESTANAPPLLRQAGHPLEVTTLVISPNDALRGFYEERLVQAHLAPIAVPSVDRAVSVVLDDPTVGVLLVDAAEPQQGLDCINAIRGNVSESAGLQPILISSLPCPEAVVAAVNAHLSAFLIAPVALDVVVSAVSEARRVAMVERRKLSVEHDRYVDLAKLYALSESVRDLGLQLQGVTAQLQGSGSTTTQGSVGARVTSPQVSAAETLQALEYIERLDAQRCDVLPDHYQSDPSWNMLSELARSDILKRQLSTTSLCLASKAPVTTALRKLEKLIEDGFALRVPDAGDNRRAYIAPTAKGQQAIMTVIGSLRGQAH